jgi:hypothetical protein
VHWLSASDVQCPVAASERYREISGLEMSTCFLTYGCGKVYKLHIGSGLSLISISDPVLALPFAAYAQRKGHIA